MDVFELPETGQGLQSWIRIDSSGNSQVIEIDKLSIIARCGISTRDLRILDPLFVYPTTILGREKAIVANLEKIRCIITADEVLLLNSLDRNVLQFVMELQKRLVANGAAALNPRGSSNRSFRSTSSYSPFEFRALAVALEVVSGSLNFEASEIKSEAYPLLDELTSYISTLNLERVRGLKSRLVALTRRIHKIRDEIEKIMDDNEYMAEMYLSEKKRRMESPSLISDRVSSPLMQISDEGLFEASDPTIISSLSSPSESHRVTKNLNNNNGLRNRHKSMVMSSEHTARSVEELESLLEAYFVVIDNILTKLITLKEYIDDTENFINIQMNNLRNRLIQFELLLTSATLVMAIFGAIIGIFGINFPVPLFTNERTIKLILIFTSISAVLIYCGLVCFFKWRRVLLL
ncbi:Magnesium transporter MRS2/LPE10 [Corchorus capsularis]|uniref:Magnesium transporter n=1 Tax=Corchorus capsularis TaxID=210143 RepID=A0A1R3ISX0_COCAP|nr:Magnesium transporter MRS2/LPE10 [Corchorus capsularis]